MILSGRIEKGEWRERGFVRGKGAFSRRQWQVGVGRVGVEGLLDG
jgi:hypothetical protein